MLTKETFHGLSLISDSARLDEVTRIAQSVADNIYTVGVSLDRCSVPRRGKQESLPFDNLEYGMGKFATSPSKALSPVELPSSVKLLPPI